MANAVLTLTRDDIGPALKRLQSLGRDTTPVMRAMGNTFKSITEGNFSSAGAEYRPTPWAPKRDGSPSSLRQTGLLWHSFHLNVTNKTATLSNPTVYAAIHQFGGIIRGDPLLKFKVGDQWVSKRSVTIPPRPFYPVSNGRLTVAAEEKIVAAGMRAVERIANGK